MVIKRKNESGHNPSAVRIGAVVGPHDPYWVQVREAILHKAEQLGAVHVPLEISDTNETLFSLDPSSLAEELLSHELDAVISQTLPMGSLYQLIYSGLPIVMLSESQLQHKQFCSPYGLYKAAQIAAESIAEKLEGRGRVLCVGGLLDLGEDKGVSRINGFFDVLRKFPDITVLHCPTAWRYDQAYPLVYSLLREIGGPVDAFFGISDSLALAARDAARSLDLITPKTVIVGINGDPLAIAAVADGSFYATIETSAEELGSRSVELAYQAAMGQSLPRHYEYTIRKISAENVAEYAVRKLFAIANLPSYLVGVNREQERHRLLHLETSAAINRQVGALLDRSQLAREITGLIHTNFGFDHVQVFTWSETDQKLYLDGEDSASGRGGIPLQESGLLGEAIRRNDTIFIPDTRYSNRYDSDPAWPETRSRVVMPVRLGDRILGLLDMHSRRPVLNLRWELIGLQLLADQFGIALRNAELYSEALHARETAERADQLKTRLLANVSHELRAPLNVILGYSQTALAMPNPYGVDLPEGLRQDLHYIYQSGEHLIHIINDLLDLSRAEIGELAVFPETIDTRSFLQETFQSIAKRKAQENSGLEWQLIAPSRLPLIEADPVRLRQILLNLLSNASKFTTEGQIILGAEVEPPYLHLWVTDSGAGISIEQQERIFEPFVTSEDPHHRREGIGLGLSITRRLVALHNGSISLESQPHKGSTFHVYLPLPNFSGRAVRREKLGSRPALLVLVSTEEDSLPEEIRAIAFQRGLEISRLHSCADIERVLAEVQPIALALDIQKTSSADWNILHRLRSHAQLSSLPLIFFEQPATGENSPSSGITNLLLKPFNGKSLGELIESLRPASLSGPVLIIDDDPQARALYQRVTEEALPGFATLFAEDGAQAIELLQKNVPSLVILDLVMPQVDGFQVLEHIRSDPRTSRVPVVVFSGKLLTFEDVRRLNYATVTLYGKGILSPEEIVDRLQKNFHRGARLGQPTSQLVKQALAYLYQNYTQPISRSELAEAVGVSDNYLSQIFRQELGLSPLECLNRLRILKARELLAASADSITIIAAKVGIDDPAYFSRVFRKLTGCSPQAFRQGAGGEGQEASPA